MRKRPVFEVGDRVGYAAAFGRSIQLDHEAMALRGTVRELRPFSTGVSPGVLVVGEWDNGEPFRVLDVNLAKLGTVRFSDPSAE